MKLYRYTELELFGVVWHNNYPLYMIHTSTTSIHRVCIKFASCAYVFQTLFFACAAETPYSTILAHTFAAPPFLSLGLRKPTVIVAAVRRLMIDMDHFRCRGERVGAVCSWGNSRVLVLVGFTLWKV
jgi:hypothetical protein